MSVLVRSKIHSSPWNDEMLSGNNKTDHAADSKCPCGQKLQPLCVTTLVLLLPPPDFFLLLTRWKYFVRRKIFKMNQQKRHLGSQTFLQGHLEKWQKMLYPAHSTIAVAVVWSYLWPHCLCVSLHQKGVADRPITFSAIINTCYCRGAESWCRQTHQIIIGVYNEKEDQLHFCHAQAKLK